MNQKECVYRNEEYRVFADAYGWFLLLFARMVKTQGKGEADEECTDIMDDSSML